MANSRVAEGAELDELTQFFDENSISSEAWELVRHRVVTDYAFKVGDPPGVVLFLQAESPEEARKIVDTLPAVERGLIAFELDELAHVMHV